MKMNTIIGVLQPRAVRAIHDPCTCACARSCMCAAEKYAPRRIRFGSRSRRERSRTWSGATFLPFSSCIECEIIHAKHVGWINTIVLQTRSPFPRIYIIPAAILDRHELLADHLGHVLPCFQRRVATR